jgi:hypothetical protein
MWPKGAGTECAIAVASGKIARAAERCAGLLLG